MNVGMLWFDNDSKASLDTKVERAAHYYLTKYGKQPTLCYVHPSMFNELADPSKNGGSKAQGVETEYGTSETVEIKSCIAGGVEVRSNQSVLPNHFWIGVNGSCEN